MKTQSFYKRRIQPLVFMAIVTIICILLTASLHLSTLDRVKNNEQFFLRRSILDAAAVKHDGLPETVANLYQENVTEKDGHYQVTTPDGTSSTVIQLTGPGLWGPITVLVGFKDDLKTLTGVSIFSQNETPGLGARIEEPWFTHQFIGKQGPFHLVEEGTATSSGEMDAITGASRTSESFKNIMNRAITLSATKSGGQ